MWSVQEEKRKREERARKLDEELEKLKQTVSEEELCKRFFKDFGCINFASDEFIHELSLARRYHAYHLAKHPEAHEMRDYERYRCYHVSECKCGFSEACDSSD